MKIHSSVCLFSTLLATSCLLAQSPLRPSRLASLPLGTFAAMFAPGDVDGDADIDLVVSNDFNATLLYLNDGLGRFQVASAGQLVSPTVIDNHAISLVDVDGDSDLDLLMGNEDRLPNRVYRNDGTGWFTDVTATSLPPNAFDTKNHVVADFDGDGDVDWLTVDLGGCHYYQHNGAGVFADVSATHLVGVSSQLGNEYYTVPPAKDLDGDGDLDALVVGSAGLLRNQGGVLSPFPTQLPVPARDLEPKWLCDLDGDGDQDIVAGRGARVLMNQGNATFLDVTATAFPAPMPMCYAALDADGDGDVDLVGTTAFAANDGSGRFVLSPASPLLASAMLVGEAVADYDGDGDLELPGSANFTTQLDAPAAPQRALSYALDVAVPVSATPTFVELFFGAPGSPVPFPGFGLLRLDIASPMYAIPIGALSGSRRLVWGVPNDPSLAGVPIAFQAAMWSPARGISLGNAVFESIL